MHKIVHFDLKGAPWKIWYFEKVLTKIKEWGATGVLLEWEDTFPYVADIAAIGSNGGSSGEGMYSIAEVHHIMQFAKDLGLEVIQLIQTIGHMEFALKHPQYKHLRERAMSPDVLCPCQPGSALLVQSMVAQALDLQPDANYFHIGADEVWHSGECPKCAQKALASEHKGHSLYLEHIRNLALFIKKKRPHLNILMWDDMLRPISLEALNAYELGKLVIPMYWDYNVTRYFRVCPQIWEKYSRIFPNVWAASAFKGANGSNQMVTHVERYISNQEAWMSEIKRNKGMKFTGIVLTGWSRFSHYATLCELLPESMPSLAACLKFVINAEINDDPSISQLWHSSMLPDYDWPGVEVGSNVKCLHEQLHVCKIYLESDHVSTFLNSWQIRHSYTSPFQCEGIARECQGYYEKLASLTSELAPALQLITGPRSATEWMETNVSPVMDKLKSLHDNAKAKSTCEPSVAPS